MRCSEARWKTLKKLLVPARHLALSRGSRDLELDHGGKTLRNGIVCVKKKNNIIQ